MLSPTVNRVQAVVKRILMLSNVPSAYSSVGEGLILMWEPELLRPPAVHLSLGGSPLLAFCILGWGQRLQINLPVAWHIWPLIRATCHWRFGVLRHESSKARTATVWKGNHFHKLQAGSPTKPRGHCKHLFHPLFKNNRKRRKSPPVPGIEKSGYFGSSPSRCKTFGGGGGGCADLSPYILK